MALQTMNKRVSLVWFKNTDLRIHDHVPLMEAHRASDLVIHLYVADKFWFYNKMNELSIPKTGKFRRKFLRESILDLRNNLNDLNSHLILRYGTSSNIIPKIVDEFDVDAVYFHSEIHSDGKKIVNDVISNCYKMNSDKKIEFIPYYGGNTLYHRDDLPFDCMANIPDIFAQFKKKIMEKRVIDRKPVESLTKKACKPHPKLLSYNLL